MLKDGLRIIAKLNEKGFKSYLVGGCVRDMIMKRPMSDIDITTPATPDEVKSIFATDNIYTIPTGLEHGTVTVVLNGANFEITTFRTDTAHDGRHCEVEFGTSLEDDLLRRDFTMNAVAFDPAIDDFIDPFGGRSDIEHRLIRAVGNPIERFREDYLRMIRAHRFEASLEFEIESRTFTALKEAAGEAWQGIIAIERIREEINKCFKQAERPSLMLEGMRKSGILEQVLPEFTRCFGFEQNRHHEFDIYEHTLRTLDTVPREFPLIRWAALFHDLGKVDACENYGVNATFYEHEKVSSDIAAGIMQRMKFANSAAAEITNLVKHHMYHYSEDIRDASVRRMIVAVGEEKIKDLCELWRADKSAKSSIPLSSDYNPYALLERLERMSAEQRVFKIKDLAIGGRDVMAVKGIPPSPAVGDILSKLHDMVLEDPSLNTREKLCEIVDSM